jgi:RNA polymerase sigma-70 factor (ECF subfamily)
VTNPKPPDDELEILVHRAQAGEGEAFARLAERCRDRIYRWALVKTGDADDAEDITQNVLVRLSTHLDRYDGRSRFTTWLYRVTANSAGGLFRRQAARRRAADAWHTTRVDVAGDGVDRLDEIHASDMAGAVRSFFRDLPAKQRVVFDLADLQGFAPAEIGEMLTMNPVTVRVHLLRARRALRQRMLERFPALQDNRP